MEYLGHIDPWIFAAYYLSAVRQPQAKTVRQMFEVGMLLENFSEVIWAKLTTEGDQSCGCKRQSSTQKPSTTSVIVTKAGC
jgi:hypothetical protein